ncbi:hypothetical protein [Pantoea sp. SS70]|uniref:hypothetical protein n=1 Tax=Pantoea sp. SS70 TaxID=3024247 RepID=UPI002453346A|nr:hypothetical protein [Pantoea sp. SS70]WGK60028.1 hypothetical protein PO881_23975 [Pantoea sp. SS70]
MRNKTREQLLIRVINMLDDAELGERHETIMNLVHSARRACRAEQCSGTMQVIGAYASA